MCTPTFFFQQIQQFFDCIFNAIRDPKVKINVSLINTEYILVINLLP